MTTVVPSPRHSEDATTSAVSGSSPYASRRDRPVRAGMAGAILVLWIAFVVALSLIRVIEQLTGSAPGASAPRAWVLVAVPWLYLAALACASAALVLAVLSAALGGRGYWAAALLLLDGPFVFLLANGFLSGPVGGRFGSSAAFVSYHLSLSELSLVGTPIGVVGCLVYLRAVARYQPPELVLVVLIALALAYSMAGILLQAGAAAVPVARRPSSLDAVLPYFIPGNQTAYFGHFTPVLLYALSRSGATLGISRPIINGSTRLVLLATLPLVLLNLIAFHVSLLRATDPGAAFGPVDVVVFCGAAGISLLAATRALRRAVQRQQRAWLALIVLVTAALAFSLVFTYVHVPVDSFRAVLASSLVGWLSADVAALIYGLWGGVSRPRDASP